MSRGYSNSPVARKIDELWANGERKKDDPFWHTLEGYSVGAEILRALGRAKQALIEARATGDESNEGWPTAEALARAKHRYAVDFEDPDGFAGGVFNDLLSAVGGGAYLTRSQALYGELVAETGTWEDSAQGHRVERFTLPLSPSSGEATPDDDLTMAGLAHDLAIIRYEESDPRWIIAVSNYGGLLFERGKHAEALSTMQRAADAVRAYPPSDPNLTFSALNNLATAQYATGAMREAAETLERLREQLSGALPPPNESRLCNNLGEIYASLERWPEALRCLERAVELRRAHRDQAPEEYLTSLNNFADVLARNGQLDRAAGVLEESRSAAAELGPAARPALAALHSQLAAFEHARGNWNEAREHAARALEFAKEVFGDEHPNTRALAANLLALKPSSEIGQSDLEDMRQELARCEAEQCPLDAAHIALSLAAMRGVSPPEAITLCAKALGWRSQALGEGHSATLEAAQELGWAHLDAEDPDSAERVVSAAVVSLEAEGQYLPRAGLLLVRAWAALQHQRDDEFLELAQQTASAMLAEVESRSASAATGPPSRSIAYLRAFAGRAIHHIVERMADDPRAVATAYLLTLLQKGLELDARRRRVPERGAMAPGEVVETIQSRLGSEVGAFRATG